MAWSNVGNLKGPKGDGAGGMSLPVGTMISCPNSSTNNLNAFAAALGDDWMMAGTAVLQVDKPIFDTSGNILPSPPDYTSPRRLAFFIKVK
ncbi:hypothetical protein [Bifidobacterium phage PMBT6]|nr:hypothetical protein [Bifidobacterium phage PMBT6]QDF14891.1 hypothetical protein [Bifidobacterium phage PMBT6]